MLQNIDDTMMTTNEEAKESKTKKLIHNEESGCDETKRLTASPRPLALKTLIYKYKSSDIVK